MTSENREGHSPPPLRNPSAQNFYCTGVTLLTFIISLIPMSVSAQNVVSGGGGTSPAGSRPQSTHINFMELVESGGEAFMSLFQTIEPATVEKPEWDSIESPRATVMTFLEAMNHVAQGREKAWDRAETTLANSGESDRQATAMDLLAIFDRLPEISPGSILGKKTVREQNISKYELFPRGIEADFVYRALQDSPRGAISLIKTDEGWLFDTATLAGTSDLLDSIKQIPPRARLKRKGELFVNTVSPTFTKTPVSGWAKFLAIFAATLGLCWSIVKALEITAKRISLANDFVITPILRGLRIPVAVVVFTVGFATGLSQIHLEPALSTFRWSVLQALFVLALIWLAVEIFELFVVFLHKGLAREKNPYATMLSLVVRRCVRAAAVVLVGIFIIQNVLEWNITALIGGIGVIALAVSLAAKDAVANLFGAITVFANRPFVSGDWVRFQEKIGEVEDVSVQVTRIKLLSGGIWSVPNMKFINNPIENLSMRRHLRRIFTIDLPYETTDEELENAITIVEGVLNSDKIVGDGDLDVEAYPPRINFIRFGAYSLVLRIDYWYMMSESGTEIQRDSNRGYLDYLEHCTKVNTLIKKGFTQKGLTFAFPTQTIHLEEDMRSSNSPVEAIRTQED